MGELRSDEGIRLTRRRLLLALAAGALPRALAGCRLLETTGGGGQAERARLTARPGTPTRAPTIGRAPLGLGGGGPDGELFVPAAVRDGTPRPLLVFLHGALGRHAVYMDVHAPEAERHGVVVLMPDARSGGTWDAIRGDFGPDAAFLDLALRRVFETVAIDPARVALAGFSDGGTYALALGRANGDLVGRVVAYSPGFLIPVPEVGRPAILITHGTQDVVLPIDRTSRRIVPALRAAGYAVTYREFDGPHAVPRQTVAEVVAELGRRG